MYFRSSLKTSVFLLIAAFAVGCERKKEDIQDPMLVKLCTAATRAEVCFADPGPGYDAQEYIDHCVEVRQPEAEEISEECGSLHWGLMECLDGRDCDSELSEWFFNRLSDGEYVCNAETTAFRKACPGVWFAPE